MNLENQSKPVIQICEKTRDNMWQRILHERLEKQESFQKNYQSLVPALDRINAKEQGLKSDEVIIFTPDIFHSGK